MIHELLKAIEEAAAAGMLILRKSQMAFDFSAPPPAPHHKAYTRTTKIGTIAQIKGKGIQPIEPTPIAKKYQTGKGETYFKGDKARYTGNTDVVGGKMFYEVKLLEGHLKGQTKFVSKAPASGDELAGAKLADEQATLGQKHLGDPKGLIDAIVKREFGKLTFRNGAGMVEPLELKIGHDSNMVTVGYKAVNAGRGEAMAFGSKPTMTGQSIINQAAAFNNYAKGIEQELKNCGIRIEDSSVSGNTLFFVSDDMIPQK